MKLCSVEKVGILTTYIEGIYDRKKEAVLAAISVKEDERDNYHSIFVNFFSVNHYGEFEEVWAFHGDNGVNRQPRVNETDNTDKKETP